jgi:hypothetical protein
MGGGGRVSDLGLGIFGIWDLGIGKLEIGIWNLEFGNWNLELGIWDLVCQWSVVVAKDIRLGRVALHP